MAFSAVGAADKLTVIVNKYAKGVVAFLGAAVTILTGIVGTVAFALPGDYVGYVTSIIALATAISVVITKNTEPLLDAIHDAAEVVDDVVDGVGDLPKVS